MRRLTVAGVVGLGLLLTAGALALVLASNHEEDPIFRATAYLLMAWSFIGAGIVAWMRRPDNPFGQLMTAVGMTVFLGALGAANDSIPFTLGYVFGGIFIAVFIHALLAFPRGYLETRLVYGIVTTAYLILTVGSLLTAFFDDVADDCAGVPGERLLAGRLPGGGGGHQRRAHRRRAAGAGRIALRLLAPLARGVASDPAHPRARVSHGRRHARLARAHPGRQFDLGGRGRRRLLGRHLQLRLRPVRVHPGSAERQARACRRRPARARPRQAARPRRAARGAGPRPRRPDPAAGLLDPRDAVVRRPRRKPDRAARAQRGGARDDGRARGPHGGRAHPPSLARGGPAARRVRGRDRRSRARERAASCGARQGPGPQPRAPRCLARPDVPHDPGRRLPRVQGAGRGSRRAARPADRVLGVRHPPERRRRPARRGHQARDRHRRDRHGRVPSRARRQAPRLRGAHRQGRRGGRADRARVHGAQHGPGRARAPAPRAPAAPPRARARARLRGHGRRLDSEPSVPRDARAATSSGSTTP